MKKKTKFIISSLAVIAFAGSISIGSTYALFTSTSESNIAITAGKVNVSASIDSDSLSLYSPKSVDSSTCEVLDDTNIASGTTFGNGGTATISGSDLDLSNVAPGDKASFNIQIANNSNIIIKYRVTYADVTSYSGSEEYKLIDALVVKTNDSSVVSDDVVVDWTTVAAGESINDVAVSVELPTTAGNNYKNLSSSLRFTVEAVQGNAYTDEESALTPGFYDVNEEKISFPCEFDDEYEPTKYATDLTLEMCRNPYYGIEGEEASVTSEYDCYLFQAMIPAGTVTCVLPDGVTAIFGSGGMGAYGAFSYFQNENVATITTVIMPDSVKLIGSTAFCYCQALTTIVMPGVETIKPQAFIVLPSIESITIPESVDAIGYANFGGCDNLANIIFEDTDFWYTADNENNWINKTGGSTYDATNSATNATNIIDSESYLYKLDSEQGNTYDISLNLVDNVIEVSGNPSKISENGLATLQFQGANSEDKLSDVVTVTGASYSWVLTEENSFGTLTLTNPTSNVSVTITTITE